MVSSRRRKSVSPVLFGSRLVVRMNTHRNRDWALVWVAILAGIPAQFFYPTHTIMQCGNGNCVTIAPGLLNYFIMAVLGVVFISGAVLVYLAWRSSPKGYLV